MTITRITKDEYKIACCDYTFNVNRMTDHSWLVECRSLHIYKLCDDLEEILDYIDFIMCI